jgi:FkbM family methyltransferase
MRGILHKLRTMCTRRWIAAIPRKVKGRLTRLKDIGKPRITHKDISRYIKHIHHPVILDAGAADGADTIRFANMLPHASIYAFEPVAKNYQILKQNTAGYPNVKTFRMALAPYDGEGEIHISEDANHLDDPATSSSLLAPLEHLRQHPHITFNQKETVPATTLDTWAKKENIDHIDVLWLDMQGIECQVLRASTRIIHTVQVIYTEINLMEMYQDTILYEDYRNWLNSIGFEVVKEEHCGKGQGNVLFVRRRSC